MDIRLIKQRAREQLGGDIFKNNWLMAVVVVIIMGAISGALAVTGVGAIATIVVTGPLTYGAAWIFLGLARGAGSIKLEDLFKGFSNDFGKNFLLYLMQDIFIFLWTLLFIIPGIVKTYSYSMAFYIRLDHPEYDWRACLDESRRMMDGHKADLFVMDLSFIGWIIVGALCLGVGTLWVSAYMSAARANFYEALLAEKAQPAAPANY